MNRTRALILSLAVGLAAIAGVFALGQTLSLGASARSANAAQVARRTAQLDRYEASLHRALARKAPALPPLPTSEAAGTSRATAPVRVVYHRPPPVVVVTHRAGGDEGDEHEAEGGEEDD